ncbi:MAG TPA: hypothetical protein DEP87_02640 [Candidatus Pacebacteria bacterium]|nr:hypothetical protein [Candidatus Paceibacterota bacterium]
MHLIIHTDGGSRGNPGPAGFGVVVREAQTQKVVTELQGFLGTKTNNEAEYVGLITALTWLCQNPSPSPTKVEFCLDSMLVVEQMKKNWKIKEPRLQLLAKKAWELLASLTFPVSFQAIPRAQNKRADQLANQAMDQGTME